jgi:hypothetical protein
MELPSQTVIDILNYLLPGFITAAIVYGLTPDKKPIPFERIVQALIFTIPLRVLLIAVEEILLAVGTSMSIGGKWSEGAQLGWSVVLAILLGLVWSYWTNHDTLFRLLRGFHELTYETAHPSPWVRTFSENRCFVVLHLQNGRRLYGWPDVWPSEPKEGHFVVTNAEWLNDDGTKTLLDSVERILVNATDVTMVELVRNVAPSSPASDEATTERNT